jgi:acetyl-CoA carboxylase biotin carboxyl carrier protein
MFTLEELKDLIRLVAETGVGGVEVEGNGTRLRIEGVPTAPHAEARGGASLLPHVLAAATPLGPTAVPVSGTAGALHSAGTIPAAASEEGLSFVTSPIVGTFYAAPSPEAEPYVKVGDLVHKGQVLCIVEAMKLMNEIEADASGALVAIYPENAQPVEFGERLFAIRPS